MATVNTKSVDHDDVTYCANPGCHCKIPTGDEYCSVNCEKQLDGDVCFCGHSECKTKPMDAP
jgi:hypothetical protein